jgi:hypothetical protein
MLVVVDKFTKWMETAPVTTQDSTAAISFIKSIVFCFGVPYSIKANGLICNGIKKRLLAPLEKAKSAWVEELPSVLWSLRTTPNAATQETPFFLVHGAEAVLPVEVTHEAPRVTAYNETTSTEALQDDVDALDEARDKALERATQYQQSLRNYHSS